MENTRLCIVRHGETENNAKHIIQGQLDSPLNETGCEQARLLGARLKEDDCFDVMIASDLQRAWKTAKILQKYLDIPLIRDVRWREICLGSWQGQSWAMLKEKNYNTRQFYLQSWYDYKEHGGESWRDAGKRIRSALSDFLCQYAGRSILTVTHGGMARIAIIEALNLVPRYYPMVFSNASISELVYAEDCWWLKRLNDVAHLEGIGNEIAPAAI